MNKIIREFAHYLEQNETTFQLGGDNQDVIFLQQSLKKNSSVLMKVLLIFDDMSIQIRIYGLGNTQYPSHNFLKKINLLNSKYKWYKFVVDDSGAIYIELTVIADGNINEKLIEYIILGLGIADDVYPTIMKSIWT